MEEVMMKTCSQCGEEFPNTEKYFYKISDSSNRLNRVCKICKRKNTKIYGKNHKENRREYERINKEIINKRQREHRAKNKDETNENRRKYNELHKEYLYEQYKINQLRRKYNLTLEQYELILKNQNSKCDICGCDLNLGKTRKVIDHCHTSNNIRGILCNQCNMTLGLVKENPETLKSMITYLEKHSTQY